MQDPPGTSILRQNGGVTAAQPHPPGGPGGPVGGPTPPQPGRYPRPGVGWRGWAPPNWGWWAAERGRGVRREPLSGRQPGEGGGGALSARPDGQRSRGGTSIPTPRRQPQGPRRPGLSAPPPSRGFAALHPQIMGGPIHPPGSSDGGGCSPKARRGGSHPAPSDSILLLLHCPQDAELGEDCGPPRTR